MHVRSPSKNFILSVWGGRSAAELSIGLVRATERLLDLVAKRHPAWGAAWGETAAKVWVPDEGCQTLSASRPASFLAMAASYDAFIQSRERPWPTTGSAT